MENISTAVLSDNFPVVARGENPRPTETPRELPTSRRRRGRPTGAYQDVERDAAVLELAAEIAFRENWTFDTALRDAVSALKEEGALCQAHPTTHLKRLRRLNDQIVTFDYGPSAQSIVDFVRTELLGPPDEAPDDRTRAIQAFVHWRWWGCGTNRPPQFETFSPKSDSHRVAE
jgi:hypothetical protein